MKTKDEWHILGKSFYMDAVDELWELLEESIAEHCPYFKYVSEPYISSVTEEGNEVQLHFHMSIEGLDCPLILTAKAAPCEIDNISYTVSCGNFYSKAEVCMNDLWETDEAVARCVYVYEEKSKQYKELCQKALESLSRPPTLYTEDTSSSDVEVISGREKCRPGGTMEMSKRTAPGFTVKEFNKGALELGQIGFTIEELSNINHTLGQYEE